MPGVEGRVQLRQDMLAFTSLYKAQMRKDVDEAALNAASQGLWASRVHIATTPSSLSPGKIGRIWTGAMYQGLDVKVDRSGNKVTITLGWLNTKKSYFLTQEYGGHAFGKDITPMFALAAGITTMKERLKEIGIQA